MQPKEHINLLGIFYSIFAGLQGLFLLLIGIYILFFLGFTGFAIYDIKSKGAMEGLIIMGIFLLVMITIFSLGITSLIKNIKLARKFIKGEQVTKRQFMVASILCFFSVFYGGIVLFPLGIALGVYSLVFMNGNAGKYYFNQPMQQPYLPTPPPPPNSWQ